MKIIDKIKKRIQRIDTVAKNTGWSRRKAAKELRRAKALGVTSYRYVKNKCWNMSEEGMIRLAKKIKVETKTNEIIDNIIENTGWDKKKVSEELRKANALGLPNYKYAEQKCWNMSEEEMVQLAERFKTRKARNKAVDVIAENTGWDKEKARQELRKAEAMSVPIERYVDGKFWELSDDDIYKLNRAQIRKEERAKSIQNVIDNTGWSKSEVKEKVAECKDKGINLKKYSSYYMFELNEEELDEFAECVRKKKEINKINLEFYTSVVCERTGWSRYKVKEEFEKAKKFGIQPKKYVQKGIYACDQDKMIALALSLKKNREKAVATKEKYINKVMELKGWSRGKTELEINKAYVNCGSSYEDYFVFKLYDLSPEEQKKYVTLDSFEKMRVTYNDPFTGKEKLDDKAVFNELFSDLIEHKWFTNDFTSYEDFLDKISGLESVIVKPLGSTQGKGIQVFKCNQGESQNRELYEALLDSGNSIVEEYIIQHPEVGKFCNTSVNTVRITTLNFNGECRYLYSVFRMGCGDVVDNFHAGGIAATIDVKTGIVCTDAADLDATVFEYHPYSNLKIKGFQIPNWDKILSTCEKGYDRVEGVNLIGWDFAVTEKGVELIEGNPGASYVVAQIPNIKDRRGLRDEMVDPYLPENVLIPNLDL